MVPGIKQDNTLQERLRKAPDEKAGVKLLKQLGSEKGYSFTEADVRNIVARMQGEVKQAMKLLKLSEEELESVGGAREIVRFVDSWDDCSPGMDPLNTAPAMCDREG